MINEAAAYLAAKSIRRREPLYSATRAASVIGDIDIGDVSPEHLNEIRTELLKRALSPRTIESTIADILTLHRHFVGSSISAGKRLAQRQVMPVGVNHDIVDAIWPHCQEWLQSWIALTMWTGLRLSDSMRVLLRYRLTEWPETLAVIASKTGKQHVIPLPKWLRRIVHRGPYRFRAVSDFAKRAIRKEIADACENAAVTVVLPKYFRQEGITQWTIANASAGAVLHGCGLKVMSHYVATATLLQRVGPSVKLPSCFEASTDSTARLIESFKRLDPSAQGLIVDTAERLAR